MDDRKRCRWCDLNSEIYVQYHDHEWGVAVHDDKRLFEFLLLEAFQAGLSWLTILKKRENFRIAFDNFEPTTIANYEESKIEELMQNTGIIRNRLKIQSAIGNAKVFLELQKEYGSFSAYVWGFTDGQTLINTDDTLPVSNAVSDKLSADLKKRGMKFVGTVTMYAYLQAIGSINDHECCCFLHPMNTKP